MKQMTEQNMINAFGGECQAHMRYLRFAEVAAKENVPNVSRLLVAIAEAERIHAFDHYQELKHLDSGRVANSMAAFGPGNTSKNLALSIAGETFEIEEMYPTYIETAKFQGEKSAERSFIWSYMTEIEHRKLFQKAKAAVDGGQDVKLASVQICDVCGYTVEGDAPDACPVCKANQKRFKAY